MNVDLIREQATQDQQWCEYGMGVLNMAGTGHAGFSRMDTNLRPTVTK